MFMKIAFATIYDARDVRRGSGWPYFLAREIECQGHSVHYLGPLTIDFPFATRLFRYLSKRVLGKRYRSYQDPFSGRRLGAAAARNVNAQDYDFFLTNDYALAAYTPVECPIVIYTDSIFPSNYSNNRHPWLSGLSPLSVLFCQRVVATGLRRAHLIAFPSRFAEREAREGYGVESHKMLVIPFGANLVDPDVAVSERKTFKKVKRKERLDILFVGKDWELKGGPIAVSVIETLRKRGVNAFLHVVGAKPCGEADQNHVYLHGFLDKSEANDCERLNRLYAESDVFLMPSKAEGFGVAYVEAAAFGLPSIGYDTMGVATAVKHGKSGVLLPLGAPPAAFADVIMGWYDEPAAYDRLVAGAREHYERNANWAGSVERLTRTVEERLLTSSL